MSLSEIDRAALDANYNLRAAVPEHPAYFARYEASSAAFRSRAGGRLDLPYGDSPRQIVDLFLPVARQPPLLVFIHGGYWQRFDPKAFSFVAERLVEAGAAVGLIGYDLAPAVDMDRIVAEIRQGLAWLHRHADEQGFDGARMFVAGHSAGGHLAAMALATDWAAETGLPADLIKGVCAISGVFDLEPIRLCYLNDVLQLTPEQVRRNSPLRLVPRTRCPVMVTFGERETAAFHEQSQVYARMLGHAGLDCELLMQPGLDHFAIIMAMAEPGNATVQAICRQMGLGPGGG
jgi:arylformamidase